jgi:hypothetical protein
MNALWAACSEQCERAVDISVNEGDWWTVGDDMSRGKGVRWQVKF